MRKLFPCGAYALVFLSCLLCCAPQLCAQQPTATTPQQPAAKPGQVHPPRAPQPAQPSATPIPSPATPREETLTPEERRVDRPPPGFDRPPGDATGPPRSMSVDEAMSLALAQASAYQQAQLDERIAAEDVKQARAAFFPQFTIPLTYFGTTPSQVRAEGEPLIYSYVSSSAINETIALFNAAGELDLSGRLRASLQRSRHLLAATRAGTLIARRTLALAAIDAYYGLVLARQKRRLAEETLSLAQGFVKVTEGIAERGEDESEGADVLRARAQASSRRDELEQARAGEAAAMDTLRVLTGVSFTTPISPASITKDLPTVSDFNHYTEELLKTRPELAQLDAQKRASLADARGARSERLPQLAYSLNGGFDAADFRPLKRYSGGSAIFTLTIPVFNFGASKSRETQARLRAQLLDMQRENTLRLLRQEFYTARATALHALARIRETDTGAAAAQKNPTIVFARYRVKKATITDVVDAQAAYAEARLAHYQAIIDYRTARMRLEQ